MVDGLDYSMLLFDCITGYDPYIVERIITAYNNAIDDMPIVHLCNPNAMWNNSILLRKELFDSLVSRDVAKVGEILQNLWRNECSEHLVKYGRFDAPDSALEQRMLADVIRWSLHSEMGWVDISRLNTPQIGNPYGMLVMNTLVLPASPHYLRWADMVGGLLTNTVNPRVGELGGGIGLLAYYMLRDIPNLQYTNFDLPLILTINQFFLMHALPSMNFRLYGEKYVGQNVALLPNFCISSENEHDVFLNFHSLSEMGEEVTDSYLQQIANKTKEYFFHENSGDMIHSCNETGTPKWHMPTRFKLISVHPNVWNETTYKEYLYIKEKNA